MKKSLLSTALLLVLSMASYSQIITETVNFDNYVSASDNDFANFFKPSSGTVNFMTITNTGGITGGAIVPPTYESWGNDVSFYCSTYRVMLDSLMETSICFKYNSSLINVNSYDRAVTVNMNGNDAYFYIERNNTITFTTYNTSLNSNNFTFTDGNWYKLTGRLKLLSTGTDQCEIGVELYDLGSSGTNTPNSIASASNTITDQNLYNNSSFDMSIASTKWGGAELVDNFTFKGIKNTFSMCGLSVHDPVTVDFDTYNSSTDNDLVNKFTTSGSGVYTQFSNNGINGGAVIPPNTVSWGNDNQRYCSSYTNTVGETYETSLCFKYDASLINTVNYDRPVSIWLSSGMHLYLNYDRTLTINTYASVVSSANVPLISGRWYKFWTQYKPIGGVNNDEFFAKIVLYEIGNSGFDLPLPVDSISGTFYDVNMISATESLVEFSGARYGGAEYLDDFKMSGTIANSNCSATSVTNNQTLEEEFVAYPNPTNDQLFLDYKKIAALNVQLKITNSVGEQIFFNTISDKSLNLNEIAKGTKGIYFLQLLNIEGDIVHSQKIILQ